MERHSVETDEIWRSLCETKYTNICYSAYEKSARRVRWPHIFKSLTLWPNLANTQVTVREFSATAADEDIINFNFQVLRDGIIGVLRDYGIVYYDLGTFQQVNEYIIIDYDYVVYSENNDMVLLRNSYFLFVRRKQKTKELEIAKVIQQVKMFITIENVIYYVTFENYIRKCTFNNGVYINTLLVYSNINILALGHENSVLYIMTGSEGDLNYTISSCVSNVLKTVFRNGTSKQEFEALGRYFVNYIDWTDSHYSLNFFVKYRFEFPQLAHIQVLRTHGPVLFAGYMPGMLCIFYSLYTTSITDLLLSEPLQVVSLLEPHKGITRCDILNIDVVEGINSHTVLVAMRHKVLAIKFTHGITDKQWLHCIKNQLVKC